MVVMGVGQEEIRHVRWRQASFAQAFDQRAPVANRAGVDQCHLRMAADEHNRAPAEAAMAYRLARIALDDDFDLITIDLHIVVLQASNGMGDTASGATPARCASACSALRSLGL